jgi:hypothetical protein
MYVYNNTRQQRKSVAGYGANKHTTITIRDKNESCFLYGPCRDCLLGNCVVTCFYNNRGVVFSVQRDPCCNFIMETV